eukprot:45990-Rhodomonas_salina.1
MGGTAILAPLRYALKHRKRKGDGSDRIRMERQIFVLTDGQVSNEAEVFELIRRKCSKKRSKQRGAAAHKPRARVFSLGVGGGVSHYLVEGMARAGGGTAEFVSSATEDLGLKVLTQLKLALQPALSHVSVTWNLARAAPPTSELGSESH